MNRVARKLQVFEVFNILIAFALLSACSKPVKVTVEDRVQPPSQKIVHHVVERGDTLFAIAWRYGLDLDKLARANGMAKKDILRVGQVILLAQKEAPVFVQPSSSRVNADSKPRSSSNRQNVGNRSEKPPVKNSTASVKTSAIKEIDWRWPVSGVVVTNFGVGRPINQGIDIRGKKGEPIIAAASGEVVFAGSGLRGYGKLIIIKHNDLFLSAYAHNDRLHVKEGDKVKVGQHIADLGSTEANFDKLHFEIRRDGRPVNPLHYLPKRQ